MDASECKAARLFRLEYVSYGFVAHATSTNLCAVNFNSSLFSSDKMTARAPHRLAHAFSKFLSLGEYDGRAQTNQRDLRFGGGTRHRSAREVGVHFGYTETEPTEHESSAQLRRKRVFAHLHVLGVKPGARMISFSNARPRKQASKQSEAVVVRKRNAGVFRD